VKEERPFIEGGRRPSIVKGEVVHREKRLFVNVVGRKNNEFLCWEIQNST